MKEAVISSSINPGDAEELITEIKINAKDFEARRVEAGIRKAKQAVTAHCSLPLNTAI